MSWLETEAEVAEAQVEHALSPTQTIDEAIMHDFKQQSINQSSINNPLIIQLGYRRLKK